MKTEKLYYEDGKQLSFRARVLECWEAEDGWDIVLDRTAFYPEGGGQPCDLGVLEGRNVLDVQEAEGVILHRLAQPLLPGTEVQGHVDGARRFDYTQQHTADHILSGVIHRRYGYDNVGFHMGQDSTFIDFNGPLEEADLEMMEQVANEAVWMDLPVEASWPAAEELAKLDYRSKKALEGPVRIVTIPGVDVCACCGTHARRTGEVGLLKILSCAKLRGGVRVEYVAGRRAYRYLSEVQLQNHLISMALSAKPLRTAEGVRRLLAERDGLKTRLAEREQAHIRDTAARLENAGDALVFEDGQDADGLRRMADALKDACGGRVLVCSGSEEGGYQYALAAPEGRDVRAFGREMNEALSGRGGGREPHFIQGSLHAPRAQIEAFFAAQTHRPAAGEEA